MLQFVIGLTVANIVDVVDALLKKKNRSTVEKFIRQQFLCLHILTTVCLLRLMGKIPTYI